ncbi:MAG TPA: ferritin-like domain-containing protein [Terriglobales bacterium]|nr:ferritin-like domain-containing protein [Terriglobales bacterium]
MQTAHELFLHELSDMLDAERNILEALEEQANECSRPDLQKAFESHRQQTEKQVERLEQAFESLEEDPEETECKGIQGLIAEHDSFKEEDPSEDLMDIFNVGAACKVEHYEIAAYTSLINLAQQMGHNKAVKLLNQNLKEEQQTLKKMETFLKKMKPERLMEEMEDEEMEETEEMESPRKPGSARKAGTSRGRSRRAA